MFVTVATTACLHPDIAFFLLKYSPSGLCAYQRELTASRKASPALFFFRFTLREMTGHIKKGNTYGTVIVDLITREVIDLLPDREADTLAKWLRGHPEITVVSRDRSSTYAMGVKNGAPQEKQVADLVLNF